uniref:L domain-like protein n=1 Tax=Grammatophora oceanica TaxID=210454 RepID=A0A7S1V1Q9_9STRA
MVSMGMDTKVALEMSTNFTRYKEEDGASIALSGAEGGAVPLDIVPPRSPTEEQPLYPPSNNNNRNNSSRSLQSESDRLAHMEQQRQAIKIFHHKQAEAAAGRRLPLGVSPAPRGSPGLAPPGGAAAASITSPLTLDSPSGAGENRSSASAVQQQLVAGGMDSIPSNRPYWQRAEQPGAESVSGRAFGAPQQPSPPPRLTASEIVSSLNTSATSAMTSSEGHLATSSTAQQQQQQQQRHPREIHVTTSSQGPTHLVEAKTVDAYDDLNFDEDDNVVYAETAPLSISHLLKEGSVRRLVGIGIVIMITIIIAVVLLVLRSSGGSDGDGEINPGGGGIGSTNIPTPAPTTLPTYLADDVLEVAFENSDPAAVLASGTPQHTAVGWLSTKDNMDPNGYGKAFVQRYAMVVLYFALEGPDWKDPEQWLDPNTHECDWMGENNIRCENEVVTGGRIITVLDNSRNQLGGTIPPEVGLLTALQTLKLSHNEIGGTVSPSMFGPNVAALDLSRNQLVGSLPTQLGGASSLESIDMSYNYLSGSLPSGIYSLRQARTINFASNQMTGTLQRSWDQMEVLNTIHLEKNAFRGRIPLLESAPKLDNIHLDFNQFTGPLPSLDTLIGRQHISLSNNQLTGTLPADSGMGDIVIRLQLRFLDLSHNKITGQMPVLLSLLPTIEHIDLSYNNITGQWPDESDLQESVPRLEFLAASHNQLTGTIPQGIPSSLEHFDLGYNQLTGGIPSSLYTEVTNLEILILSGNKMLEGTIAPELFTSLPKLRDFDCQECNLSGTIPNNGLASVTNLQILRLGDNTLEGVIPTVFGELRFLTHFNLKNNLMHGSMPTEMGKLTLMRELVLANNRFVGTIPSELGNLERLELLDLSNNDFIGSVPQGLCNSYDNLTYASLGCGVECDCCKDFGSTCL